MKDDHLDDPLSIEGGRSGSAEANGALMDFGGPSGPPPVAQTLYGATPSRGPLLFPSGHSSNDSYGNSRPGGEILSLSTSISAIDLKSTGDSHVSAFGRRSASLWGFTLSHRHHLGPGLSILPGGKRNTSILNSTPPTAFVGHNPSVECHATNTTRGRNQQDRANKCISQVILAHIHASQRSSNASTVKEHSQCTSLKSRLHPKHCLWMYSPSLLNPPISMSQTVPLPRGVV